MKKTKTLSRLNVSYWLAKTAGNAVRYYIYAEGRLIDEMTSRETEDYMVFAHRHQYALICLN